MAMIECAVPASLHSIGASLCRTVNQSRNGWMELKPERARTFSACGIVTFKRLVRLAAAKLPGHGRRAFDEEDVALSAFKSFCARAGEGQFPQLAGRDDLWRLLAALTVRKAAMMVRHQTRQKRGGGRVVGESGIQPRASAGRSGGGSSKFSARSQRPMTPFDLPIFLIN